ncbi:MAG TPA: hypothetical protein VLF18_20815, partial [Tahibacter sp.]|uniref:hypothetical protein n=1 Tax=Tahibacter sp. TaxID=2056211 RepID=UPI002C3F44A1
MKFTLILSILLALPAATGAAGLAAAFPQLAKLDLPDEGITVMYPRERAGTPAAPAWIEEYKAAGVYASAPLTLRLGDLPPLTLACDSGGSADPSCRLLRDPADASVDVFAAPGTQFVFLPDARIYVGGHANTFYDERKLYTWEKNRFVETPQALRHVGVTGALKQAIALQRTPGGAPMGVSLPAGTRVTVLVN